MPTRLSFFQDYIKLPIGTTAGQEDFMVIRLFLAIIVLAALTHFAQAGGLGGLLGGLGG